MARDLCCVKAVKQCSKNCQELWFSLFFTFCFLHCKLSDFLPIIRKQVALQYSSHRYKAELALPALSVTTLCKHHGSGADGDLARASLEGGGGGWNDGFRCSWSKVPLCRFFSIYSRKSLVRLSFGTVERDSQHGASLRSMSPCPFLDSSSLWCSHLVGLLCHSQFFVYFRKNCVQVIPCAIVTNKQTKSTL